MGIVRRFERSLIERSMGKNRTEKDIADDLGRQIANTLIVHAFTLRSIPFALPDAGIVGKTPKMKFGTPPDVSVYVPPHSGQPFMQVSYHEKRPVRGGTSLRLEYYKDKTITIYLNGVRIEPGGILVGNDKQRELYRRFKVLAESEAYDEYIRLAEIASKQREEKLRLLREQEQERRAQRYKSDQKASQKRRDRMAERFRESQGIVDETVNQPVKDLGYTPGTKPVQEEITPRPTEPISNDNDPVTRAVPTGPQGLPRTIEEAKERRPLPPRRPEKPEVPEGPQGKLPTRRGLPRTPEEADRWNRERTEQAAALRHKPEKLPMPQYRGIPRSPEEAAERVKNMPKRPERPTID